MSFRARLTLAVALAVAVAVAATSAITYVLVRNELRGQVDDALRERVSSVRLRVVTDPVTGEPQLDLPPDRFGGAAGITQLVTSAGEAIRSPDATVDLPVSERARQTAAGDHRPFFADARVAGTHLRVYTLPVDNPGLALQIARPLEEVDAALDRIRVLLFLIAAVGIALAAALGLIVVEGRARTGPAPDQDGRGGVGDARPLAPDRRIRHRRALAARGDVQHDARRARGLGAGAAPARLRRVARAAHAADQPAHEHRGARPRPGHARRATARPCCATSPSS